MKLSNWILSSTLVRNFDFEHLKVEWLFHCIGNSNQMLPVDSTSGGKLQNLDKCLTLALVMAKQTYKCDLWFMLMKLLKGARAFVQAASVVLSNANMPFRK